MEKKKSRIMADGEVLTLQDEDSQNKSNIPEVVLNGNSITQASPDATAAPANQGYRPSLVSRIFSAIPNGGYLASPEGRQAIAKGLSGEGLRPDVGILGPRTSENTVKSAAATPSVIPEQASYSNEGRPSTVNTVNPAISQDSDLLSSSIGNAGDARFNAQNGILSFTDKGFDPTKQPFAPGTGGITDPKTGRTMLLTGSDQAAASAVPATGTDALASVASGAGKAAYGNSTAITEQLQKQLAQQQAESAKKQADYDAKYANQPTYEQQQQVEADRFSRFVRQSNADSLAHDLAIGGGTARTNAGKIAALEAMRRGLSSENDTNAAQNIAVQRAKSGLAEAQLQGANSLAATALRGQNDLSVEAMRQGSPVNSLLAKRMQGEISDADALRSVRNEISSAAASGNQDAYKNAVRKGVAFGILKNPEDKVQTPYRLHTDAMGNVSLVNESTGQMGTLDRQTNTLNPVQTPGVTKYEVKVGMPVKAPDGEHSFQGQTITVKDGKLIGVR